MRNVSNKICRENKNTHVMFSNFFSGNRAVEKYGGICLDLYWKYKGRK
jgi:hypothetical protein